MHSNGIRNLPAPHSYEWYDRLSKIQDGYYYTWNSKLRNHNGEDIFLEMLFVRLQSTDTVLDVGCGHGALTLEVANQCSMTVGYDRTKEFIRIARQNAEDKGINNCKFILGDSVSPDPNDRSLAHIPVDDIKFDLVYSRRGPLNYIHDVKRVSHDGTWIMQLNPAHTNPSPWMADLPEKFRTYFQHGNEFDMRDSVYERLQDVGLDFHSYWFFDVPEYLDDPKWPQSHVLES